MKNPIFKTIAVFFLGLLVVMVADWGNPLFFSDTSIISLAEAKDKDKGKDKDKDKDVDHEHPHTHGHVRHSHSHSHPHGQSNNIHDHDHDSENDPDHVADCRQSVYKNRHIGICSNRGTVTVKGMKKYVNVSSGSGAVLADVTSKAVHLESQSGDLTARGLTSLGIFETRIGNVRVKYCKRVKKNTGNLFVKIIDSASGLDEDGDPNSSDADLQFTSNSELRLDIEKVASLFKSDFDSRSNGFLIRGSVKKGNLFISEYRPTDPPCKY